MEDNKIVFCDTSFFIRLLNQEDRLHDNAYGYYKYFLNNDYALYISTIAIAEFCVRGKKDDLPLKNVRISPFNIEHAEYAGSCAKILFDAKSAGVFEVNPRIIISNDVKLLAQANCERAGYYITSDKESKKMYNILVKERRVTFDFVDIECTYTAKFGLLGI